MREAVLPALRLHRPDFLAGALIQRDDFAVQPSEKNLSLTDRDAAAHPSAAHRGDGLVELRLVHPNCLPVSTSIANTSSAPVGT